MLELHWERDCDDSLPVEHILIDRDKERKARTPTIEWTKSTSVISAVEEALFMVKKFS